MILNIEFPNNLITGSLIEQGNIPCTIQISDKFEIIFSTVFPTTIGVVSEWDRELLDERAIAKGGGAYTHNEPGLITLERINKNIYKINELSIFYNDFGWCSIIKDGEYATPHQFWDSDDDDPDYVPRK